MVQRMARFHTLEVANVMKETSDSIVVDFKVPEALRADFAFTHGQYLTLKLRINGEELRIYFCDAILVQSANG